MKKLVLSATVIVALFTACEKEKTEPQLNPAQTNSTADVQTSGSRYYYKGQEVTKGFLKSITTENHWLVIDDKKVISHYVFDTEEELQNFAKSTPYANTVANRFSQINAAREYAAAHHSIEEYERTGIVPSDLTNYVQQLSGSAKPNGVGLMFDDLNAGGSFFPLSGSPQGTLPGFDNRAESASGAGLANDVWDKKFWGGSSRFLILGTGTVINFDGLNFQNMASSAW